MTPVQANLLRYIVSYSDNNGGASPSYDQMAAALRLSSKSGVFRVVSALEGQGWIARPKYGQRCIEILRRPGQVDPYTTQSLSGLDDAALYQLGVRIAKIQLARRDAA